MRMRPWSATTLLLLVVIAPTAAAAQAPDPPAAVRAGERVRLVLHDGSALVATLLRRHGDTLTLRPQTLTVSPHATFSALRLALPGDTLAIRLTEPRLGRLTFHARADMIVTAPLIAEVQVQRGSVPARRNTAEVFAYATTVTGGGLAVAGALAGLACQCGTTWRMTMAGGGVGIGLALVATLAEASRREPRWVPAEFD
jgi:hypothetical protein